MIIIMSRIRGVYVTYTLRLVSDWIYCHLIHSTRNYKQLQRYHWSTHFTVTVTHALGSQSSLVVPWQRIYKCLTVTAAHMKSSLHSQFVSCHLFSITYDYHLCQFPAETANSETRLSSLLPSSYPGRLASRNSTDSNDLLCPFYNNSARTTQKTPPLYCLEGVFTASLHSNGSY
jgi:hypothetical protein